MQDSVDIKLCKSYQLGQKELNFLRSNSKSVVVFQNCDLVKYFNPKENIKTLEMLTSLVEDHLVII